jgi:hypothetical protein
MAALAALTQQVPTLTTQEPGTAHATAQPDNDRSGVVE